MAASAGGSASCVRPWGLDVAWAAVAVRKESSPIGDCDLRLVCAFAIVVAGCVFALTTGPMPAQATQIERPFIDGTAMIYRDMATALSTDKSTVHQQFEHS